tara:strand:- start:1062 stop:1826 length:765 start_codon:yes stop_codon:yes gene_type:complete
MAHYSQEKKFGALIIGDEILSGKRKDKHFEKIIALLGKRGLDLSWSMYLPDDPVLITTVLKSTISKGDVTFSFGGIGATPDDHTRQCAADAVGVPLVLHPDAKKEIEAVFGDDAYPKRILMGIFPKGASIIPNPYNRIPGFSIGNHHFLPGFPVMAWPMLEWLLDNRYRYQHFLSPTVSFSINVEDAGESQLIDLMRTFEERYASYKIFSLPTLTKTGRRIELGIKGPHSDAQKAFNFLKEGVTELGFKWKLNQ